MSAAIPCRWTGEGFQPMGRWQQKCDAEFVVGEVYNIEEVTQRSSQSHKHYFACIHDGWLNLPESQAERFATSEHLRKFSLIKCGYANSVQHVSSSKAEAERLAAFIKPIDSYALVTVKECVVTVYTAQSQKQRAMGAKIFQESKQAVLDYIAGMCGVSADALASNARQVA